MVKMSVDSMQAVQTNNTVFITPLKTTRESRVFGLPTCAIDLMSPGDKAIGEENVSHETCPNNSHVTAAFSESVVSVSPVAMTASRLLDVSRRERAAQLGLNVTHHSSFEVNQSFPKMASSRLDCIELLDVGRKRFNLTDCLGDDVCFNAPSPRGSFENQPPTDDDSLTSTYSLVSYCNKMAARSTNITSVTVNNPNKAVVTIDARTSEILMCNEIACELFGCESTQLIGSRLNAVLKIKQKRVLTFPETCLQLTGQFEQMSAVLMDAVDTCGLVLTVCVSVERLDVCPARFVVIIEPVDCITCHVDFNSQGLIVEADSQFVDLVGCTSVSDVVGLNISCFLTTLNIPVDNTPDTELPVELPVDKCLTCRTVDGECFPVSLTLQSHTNDIYLATLSLYTSLTGLITVLPNGTVHNINNTFARLLLGYSSNTQVVCKKIVQLIPDIYDAMCSQSQFETTHHCLEQLILDSFHSPPSCNSLKQTHVSSAQSSHQQTVCDAQQTVNGLNGLVSNNKQTVDNEHNELFSVLVSECDVEIEELEACDDGLVECCRSPGDGNDAEEGLEEQRGLGCDRLDGAGDNIGQEHTSGKKFVDGLVDGQGFTAGLMNVIGSSGTDEPGCSGTDEPGCLKESEVSTGDQVGECDLEEDSRQESIVELKCFDNCVDSMDLCIDDMADSFDLELAACDLQDAVAAGMLDFLTESLEETDCDEIAAVDISKELDWSALSDIEADENVADVSSEDEFVDVVGDSDDNNATVTESSDTESCHSIDSQHSHDTVTQLVVALTDSTQPVSVTESQPAPVTDITESQPAPVTDINESQPAPVTDISESQPAPVTDIPVTDITESQPAPVTDITESQPAPVTDITESQPAPVTDITESQPAPVTYITESQPALITIKVTCSNDMTTDVLAAVTIDTVTSDTVTSDTLMELTSVVNGEKPSLVFINIEEHTTVSMEQPDNIKVLNTVKDCCETLVEAEQIAAEGDINSSRSVYNTGDGAKNIAIDTDELINCIRNVNDNNRNGISSCVNIASDFSEFSVNINKNVTDSVCSRAVFRLSDTPLSSSSTKMFERSRTVAIDAVTVSDDMCLPCCKLPIDSTSTPTEHIELEHRNQCWVEGSYSGRCQHKDGTLFYVVYHVKRVVLNTRQLLYCIWLSRDPDHSQLHVTEHSLQQSSLLTSTNDSTNGSWSESLLLADNNLYLSKYHTLSRIGKGAYGCVKLARHRETNKQVVVKFIRKSKVQTDCWVETETGRIPQEISLLRTLEHPNIVQVLDQFEGEHFFVMVMEKHGPGIDLFEFIENASHIDEPLASYIFRQVVSAISYLHELNIIHRDIKDENVIIDESFAVKLIDFGSATFYDNVKLFSTFCGTIEYCSPEVLQGNKYRGPELEMWSLGVTLYTLVFGENPFHNVEQAISAVYKTPFRVSAGLSKLIRDLLEPNPCLRATITELKHNNWTQQLVDITCYNWTTVYNNNNNR